MDDLKIIKWIDGIVDYKHYKLSTMKKYWSDLNLKFSIKNSDVVSCNKKKSTLPILVTKIKKKIVQEGLVLIFWNTF